MGTTASRHKALAVHRLWAGPLWLGTTARSSSLTMLQCREPGSGHLVYWASRRRSGACCCGSSIMHDARATGVLSGLQSVT
jgi:hypothetical protein